MKNVSGLKRGGQPGRKRGQPNKATVVGRELAAGLLADATYLKRLQTRLRDGSAGALEVHLWRLVAGDPSRMPFGGEPQSDVVFTVKFDGQDDATPAGHASRGHSPGMLRSDTG